MTETTLFINEPEVWKECHRCKKKKDCSLFKQKIEANGLGENPDFYCKDFEDEILIKCESKREV